MIHRVSLSKGRILTKNQILSMLNDAKGSYCYCRFQLTSNKYVMITYNKDGTAEVSTNARDLWLYNQIQNLRRSFTQAKAADFVFLWLNSFNKV